jgi:hypothetical protein
MADSEQIRQRIQSPAPFSTWLGVVLLLLVFGAIVIAVIGLAPRSDTYEQKRALDRAKKLKDLRDDDAKALTSYAWIDKNKGTVRVPIERAMELTVAELANKKPTAAGPIATPPTAAAPGGAAAASPAPSPPPQGSGTPRPTSVSGPNSEARGQPAAAVNPAPVQPKTQPGASASPAASPSPASSAAPPGSPLPVRGASPTPISR